MGMKVRCKVRRYSDQMVCATCGLAWDVNDPGPPVCGEVRRIEKAVATIGELRKQLEEPVDIPAPAAKAGMRHQVGPRLRELRLHFAMTVEEMAAYLQMREERLRAIENGEISPGDLP